MADISTVTEAIEAIEPESGWTGSPKTEKVQEALLEVASLVLEQVPPVAAVSNVTTNTSQLLPTGARNALVTIGNSEADTSMTLPPAAANAGRSVSIIKTHANGTTTIGVSGDDKIGHADGTTDTMTAFCATKTYIAIAPDRWVLLSSNTPA